MESHIEFLRFCQDKKYIPNGFDFRMNMSAAYDKEEINIDDFLKQSKHTLVSSVLQHYNQQVPRLRFEIRELNERLMSISEEGKYEQMRRDLSGYRTRLKYDCRKRKMTKMSKISKSLREMKVIGYCIWGSV